ncbi:hypothetical protein HGI30_03630 [Paenibacillus albicereus]|uniref:Uncharacterized protein n=1 Tax=Paenibacillus albicereus TaxID=2726185 RepID=A0A6H2GTK3_9BACL|nr:hypothetical protein [Paenibacillus albicereus]QJC50751.1 hypothetical protein HGI30_03630 [Paenibacillus albicereus]
MKKTLKTTAASLLVLSVAAGGAGSAFALEGQPAPAPGQAAITAAPAASASQKVYADYVAILASGNLARAVNYLNNHLSKVDSWTASMMVLRLENAQNAALGKLQKRYESSSVQKAIDAAWRAGGSGTYTSLLKHVKGDTARKLLTDSRDQGYAVATAEGMFFPIVNYPLYENWKSRVTADIQLYVKMMADEVRKPTLRDAGLVISWGELLQRNLEQEKFLMQFKGSNRYTQVKSQYELTKMNVYYGSNNTPLFDYETKKIEAEALAAYKRAVASGDASKSPLLLKLSSFLKVVEKNDGKLTDELNLWRSKQVPLGVGSSH